MKKVHMGCISLVSSHTTRLPLWLSRHPRNQITSRWWLLKEHQSGNEVVSIETAIFVGLSPYDFFRWNSGTAVFILSSPYARGRGLEKSCSTVPLLHHLLLKVLSLAIILPHRIINRLIRAITLIIFYDFGCAKSKILAYFKKK